MTFVTLYFMHFLFTVGVGSILGGGGGNNFANAAGEPFTPSVNWSVDVGGLSGSGDIFYDSSTQLVWSIVAFQDPKRKARICAIDTTIGDEVLEGSCVDIVPTLPDAVETWITIVEACYVDGGGGGTTKTMDGIGIVMLERDVSINNVGIRILYYNVISKQFTADYNYVGRNYVNGRESNPAFSMDCKTMYTTLTTTTLSYVNTTTAISTSTTDSDTTFWETDVTANRYAGFGISTDGTKLYAATNALNVNHQPNHGIYELEADSGFVSSQYEFTFPDVDVASNAWTNVILDPFDNTYHVDDNLGLVKFNGADLSLGPAWNVKISGTGQNQGYTQPTFNDAFTHIYATEGYRTAAVQIGNGQEDWNIGHVESDSWASSKIQWGPSAAASTESDGAVYFTVGLTAQCNDAVDGTLLWTYSGSVSTIVPISEDTALVMKGTSVQSLRTLVPTPMPTTANPTNLPSSSPTMAPITPTIAPITPSPTTVAPTQDPSTSPTTSPTDMPAESSDGSTSFATTSPLLTVLTSGALLVLKF